jgi:hypothetical protein
MRRWLALFLIACAPRPNGGETPDLVFPDRESFVDAGVSEFMSRRCGALDCHGDPARPLRLYGTNGLRLNELAEGRDRRPTTGEEHTANYRAVIGLEPEELSESVATVGAHDSFMLFLKPLAEVRHKGGPVLRRADPGWVCLKSWIAANADAASCKEATY